MMLAPGIHWLNAVPLVSPSAGFTRAYRLSGTLYLINRFTRLSSYRLLACTDALGAIESVGPCQVLGKCFGGAVRIAVGNALEKFHMLV